VTETAYLAPEDLIEPVIAEIGKKHELYGRLIVASGEAKRSFWAQNIWRETRRIEFESINDAVRELKKIQRNWALYSFQHHRRARLIQENLPHVSSKPLAFPAALPKSPLGSWTLLSPNVLLCSPDCSSPFPNGAPTFVESKSPPSRAYLKLWEALTLLEARPKKGDHCLDAGASPGGWTWALAELGANVHAVDRSPLQPALMKNTRVRFEKRDAFSILAGGNERYDWIFSDVASYPEKLYSWVSQWIAASPKTNFVCTIKFQGSASTVSADRNAASKFAALPGARVFHLSSNKHELTFARLA